MATRKDTDLRPLRAQSESDLQAATALLDVALTWDRAKVVAGEKLFGGNGRRSGQVLGAFLPGKDELLGVMAQAGRWIKILAVHPQARRRGIGTALLAAAQEWLVADSSANSRPKLRIGDHSGNYLSPGLDEREEAGQAFLRARGFVEVARTLNLRAPTQENPRLSDEHIAELTARIKQGGYRTRRATMRDAEALHTMIAQAFSPVWAYEVERALGPELGGAAAAYTPALPEGPSVHLAVDERGAPVAFAAHDGNNRGLGWFGPTGVLREHRGHGLGEILLLHCLRDVVSRPEGGVIAWVGPVEYYARACGARPDRRFVVYEES